MFRSTDLYYLLARLKLIGSLPVLVLGHTVLAILFITVIVSSALKGFDEDLERAAMNLGANRIITFLRVTFPVLRPAIFSAALFAFIISFDELVIALFVAGQTGATIPRKMWGGIRSQVNPTISAVSSL